MAINKNINDDITLAYLLKKTKESTLNVLNKAVDKINDAIDVINNTITEITTNMPAWIDVNISYVSGETIEDKVARLLTGTYLPRGRPFVGRVRSGSYFFVAGHLYISSGKLYGAMVFNGIGSDQGGLYGIYDSTIYKQSIRPEDVVKKAGDTMTGGLNIETPSAPTLFMYNKAADISLATDTASRYWSLYQRDKNGKIICYLESSFNTAGLARTTLSVRRIVNGSNADNAIVLNVAADGTRTISVSSPMAWRNALNLGSIATVASPVPIANGGSGQTAVTSTSTVSQIATAASGWTISSAHFSQWGKLAQIKINVKPSAAAGTTSDITVATLVSGKRPILETTALCPWPGMTYAFVKPNGAIFIRTTSWAASAERYIIATYLLP